MVRRRGRSCRGPTLRPVHRPDFVRPCVLYRTHGHSYFSLGSLPDHDPRTIVTVPLPTSGHPSDGASVSLSPTPSLPRPWTRRPERPGSEGGAFLLLRGFWNGTDTTQTPFSEVHRSEGHGWTDYRLLCGGLFRPTLVGDEVFV